jgi:hypothetical protein
VRLDEIRQDLNAQLSKAELDLNTQLTTLNSNIESSLKPINSVTAQVADAAPLFLNCEFNSDCLFNRWVGLGRGIEKMSENGAATSKSIAKITEDLSVLTHEITKPKPWYKHLMDYGKVGIYAVSKFVW